MTIGSTSPDDFLHEALLGFTGCIGEAVPDVCSYGLTIGETYVPFDPDPDEDCDAEDSACSQLWVRVTTITPTPNSSWEGTCALELQIGLEVGVLRCVEIPDDGEAPTASGVMIDALQAMSDMRAILCAAMDCEVWSSITVGTWTPSGPFSGQYGGIWTFTATL